MVVAFEWSEAVGERGQTSVDLRGDLTLKNLPGRYAAFRVTHSAPVRVTLVGSDPRLSIAVLPFQNMSRDPEQEDFCDGVVEEIISRLSRLTWLLVIPRNSTYRALRN